MLWNIIRWLFGLSNNKKVHGNAEFLRGTARRRLLNKRNSGLVIDGVRRLDLRKSFTHIAITAPTGSGKTSAYILPNILNMTKYSFAVTDPAGEILATCKGYLEKKGYDIKVLNFTDIVNSDTYNPLVRTITHSDTRKIADLLIDTANNNNQGDSFWTDSAKLIVNLVIRAVKQLPIEQQTLGEVYRVLNLFGHNQDEVNQLMVECLDNDSFEEFKSFLSQDEKVINSILSTSKSSMSVFSDPEIREITSSDSIGFEQIRERKTALFIIIAENEVRYARFILNIFYTQLFGFCMKLAEKNKPYLPMFVFLDEFANIGKINDFSLLITTLRKRKVSLSIILQDIMQLENLYGQADASVILNGGCASKIFFPGLSHKTCEDLSRTLGTQTVKYEEPGLTGSNSNRMREMGVPLMRPEEIATMKSSQAIFVHSNLKPVLIKKVKPWFKNRKLKRRAKL